MGSTSANNSHAGSAVIDTFQFSHWDSFRSLSMPTGPGDLLLHSLLIWPNTFS